MLSGLYDLGIAGRRDEFTAYTILMLCYGRNFSGPSHNLIVSSSIETLTYTPHQL